MAKKHKHPEHENLERWLVSYADFMTLLFATFTALYALSLSDVAKLKEVATAISEGFQQESLLSGIMSIIQGKSPPNESPPTVSPDSGGKDSILDKFDSMTYRPGEIKSTQEFVKGVKEDVEKLNEDLVDDGKNAALFTGGEKGGEDPGTPIRPIEATVQERGVRVSFDSRLLFGPGNATLRPAAYKFLDVVAQRLKSFEGSHLFHVEGHTDAQPISTLLYPSNWELSAARASSVVRYFIDRDGFVPTSLVAVGYGSTQPVASNDTAEGRAKNRRVDIIVYTEKLSSNMNSRLQMLKEQPIVDKKQEASGQQTIIPALPGPSDHGKPPVKPGDPVQAPQRNEGPVKVIIKNPDGSEHVLVPKTRPAIGPPPLKDPRVTTLEKASDKPAPVQVPSSTAATTHQPSEEKPSTPAKTVKETHIPIHPDTH